MIRIPIIPSMLAIILILLFSLSGCESTRNRSYNYYMSLNDYESARRMLQAAIRSNPTDAEAYYLLGEVYMAEREYSNAKISFGGSLRLSQKYREQINFSLEQNYRKEFNAGVELINGERYADAVPFLLKVHEINSDRHDLFPLLGYSYNQLNRYDDAIAAYSRAVEIEGDDINSLYNLARIFYTINKNESAIQYADKVLELNSFHNQAEMIKVYSHIALREFTKAEQSYVRISANVYSPQLHRDFGILLFNNREYKRVLPYLIQFHESFPGDHEMLTVLAETFRHVGDIRGMANIYEELLTLFPDNKEIVRNLVYAYDRLGEKSTSIKYQELLK
jgi:tetratricopeptide (TPR) repeat protein